MPLPRKRPDILRPAFTTAPHGSSGRQLRAVMQIVSGKPRTQDPWAHHGELTTRSSMHDPVPSLSEPLPCLHSPTVSRQVPCHHQVQVPCHHHVASADPKVSRHAPWHVPASDDDVRGGTVRVPARF